MKSGSSNYCCIVLKNNKILCKYQKMLMNLFIIYLTVPFLSCFEYKIVSLYKDCELFYLPELVCPRGINF